MIIELKGGGLWDVSKIYGVGGHFLNEIKIFYENTSQELIK